MDKFKRILCILLSLCIVIGFASCGKDNPDENVTDNPSTTQTSNENTKDEIKVLSLNKEYISHYEWYEDTSVMLVRSEYSNATLDKSMEKQYPLLAKTLLDTSAMRKRAMEDEKDNYISFATEEFKKDSESFSTYISTLDVQVRRADSIVVSILEDYGTEGSRSFNGINYDTESGKELGLADVFTDTSKIPTVVEKEIMSRIGEDEPAGDTAVIEYFKNTPEDSITWTLDYNGVTFYFNSGDIAPTNFGVQVVTVTFAEYPDLFNKKYTTVPDEYIVSLPVSASFYIDITGDKKAEELIVSGDYDDDTKFYHAISINSETSEFETEWFSYVEPYYVKTANGRSYICVFSVNNEEEGKEFTLSVYELQSGRAKLLSVSNTGMECKGENVFALPTNPSELLSVG
ncbi:MAG: DUF3298 domain-containing protein [Clostridia bacterium]|nr:DUF3298 domain-containing protein [Clostridia bacterium]